MADLENSILKLLAYCQLEDWAGYDPYDAMNSRAFKAIPFLDSRFPRLVLTQALKRSPVNIRGLIAVPKTQNPKAIALFLTAFLHLSKTKSNRYKDLVSNMVDRLIALRSTNVPYWCWGYSFPWQTRTIVVPVGAPNLVCTTFVANALLDAFENGQDRQCLSMALSAAEYILNELYWTEGDSIAAFSYPLRSLRSNVYNANFLAAALFCRVYKHTDERKFLEPALRTARYSASRQRPDGSWFYGEAESQRWIDNFHTGYNLCALKSISKSLVTDEFDVCMRRGFEFYRHNFFREDGAPKYFHDRAYPIDVHSVAQGIITLLEFSNFDASSAPLAHAVWNWAMEHMWDKRGFFYYRVLRFLTIRTSYMRWSQAWMLLAMSLLWSESAAVAGSSIIHSTPALA